MMSSECPISDKRLIVGYTTREHLVLDLDNTSYCKVLALACMLMESYPDIGQCLVMQSSKEEGTSFTRVNKKGIPKQHLPKECYHLIFDNIIGYERCVHIIVTLVDLGVLDQQYKRIRMFRGDMTVRVSPMVLSDTVKHAPVKFMRIINIYTNRSDNKIHDYLKTYYAVKEYFNLASPSNHV